MVPTLPHPAPGAAASPQPAAREDVTTAPPQGWRRRRAGAGVSGLAEDPVEVRAAHGAHGLGHPGALVVDAHLALGLALLLALHAVELAAPGLRHDGLLALLILGRRDGESGEARREPGHGWPRVVDDTTAREAWGAHGTPLSVEDADFTLR